MKKESRFERFKEWAGFNVQTAQTRAISRRSWAVCTFVGLILLAFAIVLWKLTLLLLGLVVIIAIVTSPVWIWIIKGEK